MRFFQPVVMVLGVATYVTFFTSAVEAEQTGELLWLPFAIVGLWNLFVFVAAVITIIDSVLKVRAKNSIQLATDAMVSKLASVPFFLVNFFVLVGMFFFSFAFLLFGGPVLWVVVPVIGVMTYFVMLSTSVYGWAAIVQMRRERSISMLLTVVFTILLFLPVADTVTGVLLFGRRRPRRALVVGLLAVGGVLIALALIVGAFDLYPNGAIVLDSFGVAAIIAAIVGFGVIIVTSVFARIRRSTLRTERDRAALLSTAEID